MLGRLRQATLAPRGRAYTLIELLVTIVIISVLIATLLPALGVARRAAQSTKNRTQVHGVLQIATVYAADHNQRLPYQGVASDTADVYTRLVAEGLSPTLLVNPMDKQMGLDDGDGVISFVSASSAEFSYSWIDTDGTAYQNSTESKTPMAADRETDDTGAYLVGGDRSVWSYVDDEPWEGAVGWGDTHVSHDTSKSLVTSYDSSGIDIHDPVANSNAVVFD